MLGTIIIVVLVLCLLGAFAGRGHPTLAPYGWYPSGGLGLIVVVLVILLLLGRI